MVAQTGLQHINRGAGQQGHPSGAVQPGDRSRVVKCM